MLGYIAEHYGDIASVLGLFIAIIGFYLTIRDVRKAERAAEEARREAKDAVDRLRLQALWNEVAAAHQLAREVVTACRAKNWMLAIHECGQARIQIAKLCEDRRLSNEKEPLDEIVKILNGLILFLENKQERTADKPLPKRQSSDVGEIVTTLVRMQAKIAVAITEF